jgi:hypothetical protein
MAMKQKTIDRLTLKARERNCGSPQSLVSEAQAFSGQRSAVSGQRSAVSSQRSAVSGQRSAFWLTAHTGIMLIIQRGDCHTALLAG